LWAPPGADDGWGAPPANVNANMNVNANANANANANVNVNVNVNANASVDVNQLQFSSLNLVNQSNKLQNNISNPVQSPAPSSAHATPVVSPSSGQSDKDQVHSLLRRALGNDAQTVKEIYDLFVAEDIDWEALNLMTDSHFKHLGIKMGARVRIVEALKAPAPTAAPVGLPSLPPSIPSLNVLSNPLSINPGPSSLQANPSVSPFASSSALGGISGLQVSRTFLNGDLSSTQAQAESSGSQIGLW
jgi:hypothetical protein